MALILHIDTALQKAFVGLSQNGELLAELVNEKQNDHAAFIQPAIVNVLEKAGVLMSALQAVGVTAGPGSYTGLRVGMASAKGICYAFDIPLLAVSTLDMMAMAAIDAAPGYDAYCPMIDARRDEVYTALFNNTGKQVMPAQALILNNQSFKKELLSKNILFTGNGAEKWKAVAGSFSNAFFAKTGYKGKHLAAAFFKLFKNNEFCDLAYAEPFYLKDFHFAAGKNKE
ncbi:MAG: tRNA (adenosine(37)-N6)-threonylcarbamoyltransferase complex dimerization subunit type 1 TsaB [Chitinophagaceae bacterium]|nr:tRNA (adenosine(37)-N6)-threonylcarbamoyltransferase complex dimerization subunit type 1 TsaB [Chitinophagaceae bacterium]